MLLYTYPFTCLVSACQNLGSHHTPTAITEKEMRQAPNKCMLSPHFLFYFQINVISNFVPDVRLY
jgi:hypothetical protein